MKNTELEIHNVNNRIAKSSLIGPVEVVLPSRKAFIEKVRELTEVKWDVINKTPSEILGKFRQMAFEFHDFEKIEKEPELYLNKKYYEFEEKEVVFPWALDACNLDLFREHVLGNWGKRS